MSRVEIKGRKTFDVAMDDGADKKVTQNSSIGKLTFAANA